MLGIRYRISQLVRALAGRIDDGEAALVAAHLGAAEQRLFLRMARFDQRHCLDVFQTLARSNHTDPALLAAALLHDCGKVDDAGRPIPLLYYGVFVVLKRLAPWLYWRATRYGKGVLRPFATHAAHEQRSAALVAAAGGAPELVAILRDYAAERATPQTTALGWADDQN